MSVRYCTTRRAHSHTERCAYHYERERSQLTPLLAQRIAESIINIFNLVDAGASQETVDDAEPSFRAHNNGGSQPFVV